MAEAAQAQANLAFNFHAGERRTNLAHVLYPDRHACHVLILSPNRRKQPHFIQQIEKQRSTYPNY